MMYRLWLYEKSRNLYYRVLKNPKATKAVIFLHGMGGSSNYWSSAYKKLYRGHSLYFVDLLGFGYSHKPKGRYDLTMHLKALHKFIQEEVDEEKIILVGHSMGAIAALAYAASHSEKISKCILLSLGYYLSPEQAKEKLHENTALASILDDSLGGKIACHIVCHFRPWFLWFVPFFIHEYPKLLVHDSLLHTPESYFGTLRNTIYSQDIPSLIKKIPQQKIIALHGENDQLVPFQNIEELVKLYNLKVEKVQGDHDFPLEHPQITTERIKKYLNK